MNKIRKLIAAIVGVGVLIGFRYYDIDLFGLDAFVMDLVLGAATVYGVYQVPNEAG